MQPITSQRAILAVAMAVSVALIATLGASAMSPQSSSAARASAVGRSLAAEAYWAHGKVQDPPAIASRMSSLNGALDACLTSHGATRVSIAGGGWTYQDPHGAAQVACQSQQDAVMAFADGPEMVGYSEAIRPLIRAFWSCMVNRGIVPPNADDVNVDIQSPAFTAGADACSAAANSKSGVTGPHVKG